MFKLIRILYVMYSVCQLFFNKIENAKNKTHTHTIKTNHPPAHKKPTGILFSNKKEQTSVVQGTFHLALKINPRPIRLSERNQTREPMCYVIAHRRDSRGSTDLIYDRKQTRIVQGQEWGNYLG